jgi:hypothetical protein
MNDDSFRFVVMGIVALALFGIVVGYNNCNAEAKCESLRKQVAGLAAEGLKRNDQ